MVQARRPCRSEWAAVHAARLLSRPAVWSAALPSILRIPHGAAQTAICYNDSHCAVQHFHNESMTSATGQQVPRSASNLTRMHTLVRWSRPATGCRPLLRSSGSSRVASPLAASAEPKGGGRADAAEISFDMSYRQAVTKLNTSRTKLSCNVCKLIASDGCVAFRALSSSSHGGTAF